MAALGGVAPRAKRLITRRIAQQITNLLGAGGPGNRKNVIDCRRARGATASTGRLPQPAHYALGQARNQFYAKPTVGPVPANLAGILATPLALIFAHNLGALAAKPGGTVSGRCFVLFAGRGQVAGRPGGFLGRGLAAPSPERRKQMTEAVVTVVAQTLSTVAYSLALISTALFSGALRHAAMST
jgi:hypothetical protein